MNPSDGLEACHEPLRAYKPARISCKVVVAIKITITNILHRNHMTPIPSAELSTHARAERAPLMTSNDLQQ